MEEYIRIQGAREHNLKNISIDLPKNKLVVITGLSGSGKSSLAFDTLYAEGQRRYVESLSAYARQFLQMQNKPDVDSISGLSPAIAIDQKTTSKNPRSTVGTVTEIYDYMRLLFARVGVPYSPATGEPIQKQTVSQIVDAIMTLKEGTRFYVLAPVVRGAKGEYRKLLQDLIRQGYQRFYIDSTMVEYDELPTLDKNIKHTIEVVIDRMVMQEDIAPRLTDSVQTALHLADGLLRVEIAPPSSDETPAHKEYHANSPLESLSPGEGKLLSERYACPVSGFQIAEIEPRLFSFNSPFGACPQCEGIGIEHFFDPALIVPNPSLSLREEVIAPYQHIKSKLLDETWDAVAQHYSFDIDTPFQRLPKEIQTIILYGSGEESVPISYYDGIRRKTVSKPFEGVIPSLEKRLKHNDSATTDEYIGKFRSKRACQACHGYRLRSEALCIKLDDHHIGKVTEKTIIEATEWFQALPATLTTTQYAIAERVLKEIKDRLQFLIDVGLGYLTLSRGSGTLSGGESQRIRLASQVGSGLCGVLYVLDEPSIGLHQSDNHKLIQTLINLRDLGNTVIVVEHDEDTMHAADYIVDIGPGAGVHGGHIIAKGTPEEIMKNPESITGQYLTGARSIPVPTTRRTGTGRSLALTGARAHNLSNVSVTIPIGAFTCVTGVSGSGKSSLILYTLYRAALRKLEGSKKIPGPYDTLTGLEYIDKIIEIDQSPIGRTPRSNPATYVGAFTPIRDWYVELPESKMRGYKAGRFSFNVKGGRCEACQGDGLITIEMHFLPDVYVVCDECKGMRYNRETLEVKYNDKSIADVLKMTVEDAIPFFHAIPSIHDKLKVLDEVGLGYVKLGQSATTLSGGEAQRVKLAKELAKKATGRTLYILDEPTTGLHVDDIKKLLHVLHKFVELGNTVLVIEHNMDVIKTADHIVDIGPGGGDKGGNVVASCTPEELVDIPTSITGQYLKKYL